MDEKEMAADKAARDAALEDERGLNKDSIEDLEKDFQRVLAELMGEESLKKFAVEYEKLHNALSKSQEGEKRLMNKCRDLNSEIVSSSAKVNDALKISGEDKATLVALRQEIDKLWKMVDAAHSKENHARETINQLKLEISNLTKLVESGAGLNFGQDTSVQELTKMKDELIQQRDEQLKEIVTLRKKLTQSTDLQHKAEQERTATEEKILELREEISHKVQEVDRETRRKAKLEKDYQVVLNELEERKMVVQGKDKQVQQAEEEFKKCDQHLRETMVQLDRAAKDNEILTQRLNKAQQDYENQLMQSDQLAGENSHKNAELKLREDEIANFKADIARINKLRDGLQRKLRIVEEQKHEVESSRESLKQHITSMEREIQGLRKQSELDKKSYDDLLRERDILSKDLKKAEGSAEKLQHLMKIRDQSIQTQQQEIANHKEEIKKQRQMLQTLERERDRYGKEASDVQQKCIEQMEEVKRREVKVYQLKKKVIQNESKLKQQHTLYEAVCSDRNLCSKNLVEARDEITEMKRKLKIMSHQIDQLKEEIASKEATLVRSNMDLAHMEREKEGLSAELSSRKQELETTKQLMENQRAEERKLRKVIAEASAERTRQKKELEQVISERDLLGTQVIRRNDELALLYEKLKIQESTLHKGEAQYTQRVEDIRILKLEIKKMRRERNMLSKNVANVDDLRRELYHIQRELLRERTRCKALEEELENPMNIHRWRKLEGNDPSTYEMIQKIHVIQKKLIAKTEEVVEKELQIQEREKLYMELKQVMQRQPGPEVAEQLQIYQQTLKEKTKQMKGMASELNMHEAQVVEHKMEIERLQRELQEVKKKYYMQKKREHNQRERERVLAQGSIPPMVSAAKRAEMPRFTGGGFNLKQYQKSIA